MNRSEVVTLGDVLVVLAVSIYFLLTTCDLSQVKNQLDHLDSHFHMESGE